MSFTIVAIVIAALCVAASARRLVFAAEATGLDAGVLLAAVRDSPDAWPAIREAIAQEPTAAWERELLLALDSKHSALVNEQLGELDYTAQRWARVPRVCASIASSSGFLLAALVMRDALASDDVDVNSGHRRRHQRRGRRARQRCVLRGCAPARTYDGQRAPRRHR